MDSKKLNCNNTIDILHTSCFYSRMVSKLIEEFKEDVKF